MYHIQKFQWRALGGAVVAAVVEGLHRLPTAAAARSVDVSSSACNSLKKSCWASTVILSTSIDRLTAHSPSARRSFDSVGGPPLQLQQRRHLVGPEGSRSCQREDETDEQKEHQESSVSDQNGGEGMPLDAPSVAQRVLEAAQNPTAVCGSSFWASQREEVMRSLKEGELSLSTAALLMVAFSRAGELTGPLATAVAERLCTAFRAATRGGATRLLLEEGEPPLERALTMKTSETDFRVHFSDGATVLFAMKEGGLLQDPCAGAAARELQEELLLCVQPQWGSLTFTQLRRVFLLLGATSEPLGLSITVALELLNAVKKRLRKMQKMTRRLFEGGDARDTVALVWPLACISAAFKIPAPQISSSPSAVVGSLQCCSNEDTELLRRDRDIVLQLLKVQGFAGLQRLGQQNCAEYVLAAFSAAAAAASCEELCRLGRDILLAGARQKALWEAFADAVQAAAEERLQTEPGKQRSSTSHQIEAELYQWLRFCGRTL